MIELQLPVGDFLGLPGSQLGELPALEPVVNGLPTIQAEGVLRLDDAAEEHDHVFGVMSLHPADGTRPCTRLSNYLGAVLATLYGVPKQSLRQRLQTIMDAMGWSQADLARAAKASRQNVTNWMTEVSGTKKNMEPRFAFNLMDETRFNARWIIYGDGPARIELADPADLKLLQAISRLPPDRKRVLAIALDLAL